MIRSLFFVLCNMHLYFSKDHVKYEEHNCESAYKKVKFDKQGSKFTSAKVLFVPRYA